MPHQNLNSYLPSQLNGDDVDGCMLAAEKAIAHFELLGARTAPQCLPEVLSEQSCCEEEEDLLKLSYLSLKLGFEEAHHHLKEAKQTLKHLENVYHAEKKLELTANMKAKSDAAYQRFVGYREKQFNPVLQSYKEIRKTYYRAFMARKISQLKSFVDTIKEIFECFIIKPIKYLWKKLNYFNTPFEETYYDGVGVCIEKEKESRRGDETFRILYSPLEKIQGGLENQKETKKQTKQVVGIEIIADSVRYRHR